MVSIPGPPPRIAGLGYPPPAARPRESPPVTQPAPRLGKRKEAPPLRETSRGGNSEALQVGTSARAQPQPTESDRTQPITRMRPDSAECARRGAPPRLARKPRAAGHIRTCPKASEHTRVQSEVAKFGRTHPTELSRKRPNPVRPDPQRAQILGLPGCSDRKESARSAGDLGSAPGLGRRTRGGRGIPF